MNYSPKVAHLTSVHPPFDTRIFHKECVTLAKTGYHVSLVSTHVKREAVNGVHMVPLPSYGRRLLRMSQGAWAVYKTARALQADLYHFHDPELLPVGVLLKLTTPAKVIYDAHEHYAKQLNARMYMSRYVRGLVLPLLGVFERLCAHFFDAVVCATDYIASFFPDKKAVVIRNYPFLKMGAHESLSEAIYQPGNSDIIYTGGWSNHRGVYQIVQALGHVHSADVRLKLYGRCVDPLIQEQAAQLPGYARVDYVGMVPYAQLYDAMRSAAVGMVCNQPGHDYDKSQPNKLFEYMSCGLPVVASNFPAWREIVEGHTCGLTVDPTQPREIAKAIDILLSAPQQRREMGQNGRQAVLTHYNWQPESEKLLHLYQRLLSQ